MEQSTRGTSRTSKDMDLECKHGLMALNMKANGSRTRLMVEASFGTLTATFMKVNGSRIKLTGMEFMSTLMERVMKVNGETISKTVLAKKAGKTARAMPEDTWKA